MNKKWTPFLAILLSSLLSTAQAPRPASSMTQQCDNHFALFAMHYHKDIRKKNSRTFIKAHDSVQALQKALSLWQAEEEVPYELIRVIEEYEPARELFFELNKYVFIGLSAEEKKNFFSTFIDKLQKLPKSSSLL